MPRGRCRCLLLLMAAALLPGCALNPCDRIRADFRQLNADALRDPAMVADGRYGAAFRELGARSVEHGCLNEPGFLVP